MKKILIAALTIAATLQASAQQTQRLEATKANDYGIVYTLPQTALDVTIEAQITERQPGEFAKYAMKYLAINNTILEPSTVATLKSVTINTAGVPNDEQRYLVTLKSSQAPYIILDANGLPLAINTEETASVDLNPLPVAVAAQPTPLETKAAQQVISQEMLQSRSSAKRAELAAQMIYDLRQSRNDIITGQADQMPPDGAAMKLVLDNIDAQEQALLAMFVGTTKVRTEVATFRIIPEGDITDMVIARISAKNGVVEPTDLLGAPVYLSLNVTRQGELPTNEKGELLPFPKGGVAYNIPGIANVAINYDGRTVGKATLPFAQFGVVYGMAPANFTDKKAPVYLIFDPATGAALEVGKATPAN